MYRNILKVSLLLGLIILSGSCGIRTSLLLRGVNQLMDSLKLEHFEDTRTEYWSLGLHGDSGVYSVRGELVSQAAYEALDKALKRDFPGVKNEVILLTSTEVTPLANGLVNNSVIHLRRQPSSRTEMVTQALLGRPVRILKEQDGKALIQIPEGYLGWVNVPEISPLAPDELVRYRDAEKLIFQAQYGMAFSEPDERSLPVADLVTGCILEKVPGSVSDGFQQVRYPDGRLAWVREDQCLPAEKIFFMKPERQNLVTTAMKFHGIPYLWGGTSSKAIDCSGLISNVYFMNGIQLPRDADQQTHVGKEITTEFVADELLAGDLLFFGRKASEEQPESVTHVAMYIGNGEYIHSAGYRERVSINSMDSLQDHFIERYPEIFIRAVRILDEQVPGIQPIAGNPMLRTIIAPSQ